MTRRASPSAPMISIASTQLRTLPLRTERGPAALVATMPPDVANAPEDGSGGSRRPKGRARSEEHTSELQSPCNLVCRLLLEKKKRKRNKVSRYEHTTGSPNGTDSRQPSGILESQYSISTQM